MELTMKQRQYKVHGTEIQLFQARMIQLRNLAQVDVLSQ